MPLKIAVCMKQVPNVARIRFDPETRRVIREGVPALMDSFENRALAFAVEFRRHHDAHVTAITMGPPQAREILEQALAVGADAGIHLSDRAFAGADTLATSRALALALRQADYDLILCGRHSTDSETGQVGPELAEHLDVPHLSCIRRLEIDEETHTLHAERESDDGIDVLHCPLPALVTVSEEIGEEVWPQAAALEQIDPNAIRTLSAADLGDHPEVFGAEGSPTWVAEVYAEETARRGEILSGDDVSAIAEQLVEKLIESGVFAAAASTAAPPAHQRPPDRGRAVWVWAEQHGGELRPSVLEILGVAGEIADAIGGHTVAVVLGANEQAQHTLAAHGADEVLVARDDRLAEYDTAMYTTVLAGAIQAETPYAVLLPASANGRDLAPRVAARLGLGLTGDCIGFAVQSDGSLAQLKPAFGGNIIAPVYSRTWPQMATVRPGLLTPPTALAAPTLNFRQLTVPDELDSPIRLLGSRTEGDVGVNKLESAAIVVGVGRGIGGPEGLPLVQELAGVLEAEIGATRAVADVGWLPRQRQIGLTGRAVSPALYIAVGVSGGFNHTVGVLKAGTIVAVNRSQRAPITKAADYTIVGDWMEVVPALIAAFTRARLDGRLLR